MNDPSCMLSCHCDDSMTDIISATDRSKDFSLPNWAREIYNLIAQTEILFLCKQPELLHEIYQNVTRYLRLLADCFSV